MKVKMTDTLEGTTERGSPVNSVLTCRNSRTGRASLNSPGRSRSDSFSPPS